MTGYPVNEEEIQKRFAFHPFTEDQRNRAKALFSTAAQFGRIIMSSTPYSREQSLALTHLDVVVSYAIAAMVRNEKQD